jgi:hypothetical protein
MAHNLEIRALSKLSVITDNQKCLSVLVSVVNKTYHNNTGKSFPCIRLEK